MKRYKLILFVLFIISFYIFPDTSDFSVMTFNIWKGGQKFEKVIEAIQKSNADIIGLQEAPNFKLIAEKLGYFYDIDNWILSKFPIVASLGSSKGTIIRLPNGQPIYVFNIHLTAYPYPPYELPDINAALKTEKSVQLKDLLPYLENVKKYINDKKLCILSGDFNIPSHLDYDNVPWQCSKSCLDAGLIDTYRTINYKNRKYPEKFRYDEPGITWTPRPEREENGCFDRIDYIYYSGKKNEIIYSNTFEDVKPWPSDHRAVITKFSIETRETIKTPEIATEKIAYKSGEDITAQFSNVIPFPENWVGIYKKGGSYGKEFPSIIWAYIDNDANGVINFKNVKLEKGEYEIRLFSSNSYVLIAKYSFKIE